MRTDRGRNIKPNIEKYLWGISAGRCEFEGCNKFLGEHPTTKTEGNFGEKAHIEAVSKGGARYRELMSGEELNSAENIMLLCPACHKFIDENEDLYPVSNLRAMKRKHEERVYTLTQVDDVQRTLMIGYFANIKEFSPRYEDSLFCRAVVKNGKLPINKYATQIGTQNMPFNDGTSQFYRNEQEVLRRAKETIIKPSVQKEENLSVFALAPVPLLIELGTLLSDISNVSVYQCHREGDKWAWKDTGEVINYIIESPKRKGQRIVALNISLSAEISQERIDHVKNGIMTYKITIPTPNRTFVNNEKVADDFVAVFRQCMEQIKSDNSNIEKIMVFPAMPNSLAIRAGMDYMPKTDPLLEIYDQISIEEGFIKALEIGGKL